MDTIKIDYHLSHYRAACHQLSVGIASPRESARLEAIRDASLCAIALEANIITMIGNGELPRDEWGKAIAFIKYYEASQIAEPTDWEILASITDSEEELEKNRINDICDIANWQIA